MNINVKIPIALAIAPLAAALVIFAGGDRPLAETLRGLGYLFAAAAVWLVAAPGSYRRLARSAMLLCRTRNGNLAAGQSQTLRQARRHRHASSKRFGARLATALPTGGTCGTAQLFCGLMGCRSRGDLFSSHRLRLNE